MWNIRGLINNKSGSALLYVMIVIVILVMVVAVALVATANANRQSAFVKDYEQSYYSAESAAMVATELFRAKVAEQLADESSSAQEGLFYCTSQTRGFDIVDYVQTGLQCILDDVTENNPDVQKLIAEDELFEGKDVEWTLSVLPFDDGVTENGGCLCIDNSIISITAATDMRKATVNIHYEGQMGAMGSADGGNLLETNDKENEIRGIMADRDRFFDMANEMTGLDPNDPDIVEKFGGTAQTVATSGNFIPDPSVLLGATTPTGALTTQGYIVPITGSGVNNTGTQQMLIMPWRSVHFGGNFQQQFPNLQNVFIEPNRNTPVTSYTRGGYLIFRIGGVATGYINGSSNGIGGRFVSSTGAIHFDGRHEAGEPYTLKQGVDNPPPLYGLAANSSYLDFNTLYGHMDTRCAQIEGKYDYFSYSDYDQYYQPLGTNFYVGEAMLFDGYNTQGNLTHFINNARIAVKSSILIGFAADSQMNHIRSPYTARPLNDGTVLKGNSVYISESEIVINAEGALQIGEKDGLGENGAWGRAPHFISQGNININYIPGSKIKLYGVFGTLGEYRGPNFVDDPNVDVAGMIFASKGYYDSATDTEFNVPPGFFDRQENQLQGQTEYLDTSFFSQGFTMTGDRIVNIVEN